MIYDLIIIGGGINGAAVARDAGLRGLKCILLEKSDFGAGASTKTSKLAHGGVRYLEHFEFSLVRESLRERELLLKNAPHLVRQLRFVHPVYEGDPHHAWTANMGLYVYDFFAWLSHTSLPYHTALSREQVSSLFPHLRKEGIHSAVGFSDALMDDRRILMENVVGAAACGVDIFNDAQVVAIHPHQNSTRRVEVRLKGESDKFPKTADDLSLIEGRCIVNATGAWSLPVKGAPPEQLPKMVITKGIHLVIPAIQSETALLLRAPRDLRPFFVIPWEGMSLVGTTDTLYEGDLNHVTVTDEDCDYLLEALQYYFPKEPLAKSSIVASYAGLRPLADPGWSIQPSEISRRHEIQEPVPGIFTISGGKYTTHRSIAEKVVDQVVSRLRLRQALPCKTAKTPLPGALDSSRAALLKKEMLACGLSDVQATHLIDCYGHFANQILKIVKRDPDGKSSLCAFHPHIQAELTYAVKHEFLKHIYSWFTLRTTIAYTPCKGRCCMHAVADKMQQLLGWSPEERQAEIDKFLSY